MKKDSCSRQLMIEAIVGGFMALVFVGLFDLFPRAGWQPQLTPSLGRQLSEQYVEGRGPVASGRHLLDEP